MSHAAVHDGQGSTGGSLVEQGTELVSEQARAARETAGQKVGQQVESGSKQFGEQLLDVVQALSRTSHGLRAEGKDQPASVLEGISTRAEGLGTYLIQTSPERMLHDFEHFGRRKPWLAIAGGIALGVAASRFLKASSSRRFDDLRAQGYSSSGPYPIPPATPHAPELG
jgi:hypothetical protein